MGPDGIKRREYAADARRQGRVRLSVPENKGAEDSRGKGGEKWD